MVDAVQLERPVAQQQGDVFAHLHHRAEIGAAQPVAVEPELQAPEAAVALRMERDDADPRIGQRGAVVEPLGVVILHVEVHGPRHLAVERAVEFRHALAVGAVAEEHRVRKDIISRADGLETLVEGKVVHRHEVVRLVLAPRDEPRQIVGQRGTVAEDHDPRFGFPDRPGAPDVVAEVLLDGHHGEVKRRVERVADQTDGFFGEDHGMPAFDLQM